MGGDQRSDIDVEFFFSVKAALYNLRLEGRRNPLGEVDTMGERGKPSSTFTYREISHHNIRHTKTIIQKRPYTYFSNDAMAVK